MPALISIMTQPVNIDTKVLKFRPVNTGNTEDELSYYFNLTINQIT